jgi:GntR family transcriptional regulator
MDIEVDPLSEVPIYQQIRDRIVEAIASGRLVRGSGLASVRSLAAAFAINPATVAKAYDQLRHEGLVATTRKSGSMVARDHASGPPGPDFVNAWSIRLRTLLAEGRAYGLSDDDVVAVCRAQLATFETKETS